ncbi:MAG: aminotransferase class V-fold PLP-dependent enzyme [Candidatus Zixiibacteriota bacterium]|nr:MAG: aminotransferase class V-fold PLP-dependent enzyme [candidate division Zixibacteria bacterium]
MLEKEFQKARSLFPHAGKVVYFNSASFGPFCQPVREAIEQNLQTRVEAAIDDTPGVMNVQNELRGDYAGLIGASPRQVGIGMNTSFGLNIAAFGLPLKPGDEVLVSDVEFPAQVYTWRAAAQERRLKLTFVESNKRRFDIDSFERALTDRSKVLALSFVQYFNGYKNDLAAISEVCQRRDIFLVVDGIQGMGVEPIDVKALGMDVFSSGCQKWMLGPQGCGFFYLADQVRDRLSHPFMGWLGVDWKMNFTDLFKFDLPYFDSARRFEMGYYVALNILGMKASVELFKTLGIENIQHHNYALIDRLADYIRGNDFYTITSFMEPRHRSSIFSFTCGPLEKLFRRLADERSVVAQREGSIRVSVHLFNDESDIDRLISALDDFSGSYRRPRSS